MNKTDKQVTLNRAKKLGFEINHRLNCYYIEKEYGKFIYFHGDFKTVSAYIDGVWDAKFGILNNK